MKALKPFTATTNNPTEILITLTIKKLLVKASGPFSYSFPQPSGVNDVIPVSQPNEWKEKEISIDNNSSIAITAIPDTAFEFFKVS